MTDKAKRKLVTRSVTKSAVLRSCRFRRYRDVLAVILKDDERYTVDDIRKKLKDFYRKEVN